MDGEEFDTSGALAEISEGLGFGDSSDGGGAEETLVEGTGIEGQGTATPVEEAAPPSPEPAEPAPAEPAPAPAPRTWRAEAAAEFGKLPAVVQQEILKREEDIFKGIEGYKADAAFGKQIGNVMAPYLPILTQYGIQPEAQIQDMMQAHYTLAFGSAEQKTALLQQFAQDYGLDLGQAAATAPYLDPQVATLQKELQSIKSQLTQTQQQELVAKRSQVETEVTAFATDPKNVYFEELANDIAHLIRTGAETTIAAAYEKALWSNPAIRAKELSRQQAEKEVAERKTAEEAAAKARKATSANVHTKARGGSAAAPVGSIDDTLNETLASIRGRS